MVFDVPTTSTSPLDPVLKIGFFMFVDYSP